MTPALKLPELGYKLVNSNQVLQQERLTVCTKEFTGLTFYRELLAFMGIYTLLYTIIMEALVRLLESAQYIPHTF